jgi:AcrR family transcriptional regulator
MYTDFLKRKEKVIISAIDILDEVGIQGLTTKEIAKREGITEPAIYRQYDSKQDIIMAILDRFSKFDKEIFNTVIEQNMSAKDGILFFAKSYASYYQNYPQLVTVLFSFDVFRYDQKLNDKMSQILNLRTEFINGLAQSIKDQHDYKISAEDFATLINGSIWTTIYIWKLNGCKGELKEMVAKRTEWLLDKSLT